MRRALLLAAAAVAGVASMARPSRPPRSSSVAFAPLPGRLREPQAALAITRDESQLSPGAARSLATLSGWHAHVDRRDGAAQRIFGPGILAASPGEFAARFVEEHRELLGLSSGITLVPRAPVRSGRFTFVFFDESVNGIPVDGARADLRFAGGAMSMARFDLARDLSRVERQPRLSQKDALDRAAEIDGGSVRIDSEKPLVIAPRGNSWRLAWRVRADGESPRRRRTIWIDALDGGVLGAADSIRHGTPTTLTVSGSHEHRRVGDTPEITPWSFSNVVSGTQVVADSNGLAIVDVAPAGQDATLRFRGQWLFEDLFGVSSSAQTSAVVPLSAGVPASFEWNDSNSTLAERDLYAYRLRIHDRHKVMAPDIAWVDEPLRYELEIQDGQGCNAFWDGILDQVNLYAESAVCNDTARVADVVFHETTHGLHQHLSAGGGIAADVGEGSADYVAASINGDPEIGPTFYKATGAGIRALEPPTVYPADATGEPHNDGLIWGGSFWEFRGEMIASLGTAAGLAYADRLLADTLRADPTLEDGIWDALFADDDDADLSNGSPHDCEIVKAFGDHGLGPGDKLSVSHVPLGAQSPGAGVYRIRAHIESPFPQCFDTGLSSAALEWRLRGEPSWTVLPMHPGFVPGWREAEIPAQTEGAVVEYRIHAIDAAGRDVFAPSVAADVEPFSFPVLTAWPVFYDDFETDRGWKHHLVQGSNLAGSDDWQRGDPRGQAGDPRDAFSGSNVWGNDLGLDGLNGAYANSVDNRLTSPEIDCSHASGVHLQFRRWLTIQAAPGDEAIIRVNGHPVWINPVGNDVVDTTWRFIDLDISKFADGRKIRVSFDLKSDFDRTLGGWTLDDVEFVATGTRDPVVACSVAGTTGALPGDACLLAALACLVVRRRRAVELR